MLDRVAMVLGIDVRAVARPGEQLVTERMRMVGRFVAAVGERVRCERAIDCQRAAVDGIGEAEGGEVDVEGAVVGGDVVREISRTAGGVDVIGAEPRVMGLMERRESERKRRVQPEDREG